MKKLKLNDNGKLIILYLLQILVIIAPVLIVIILKREEYFTKPEKVFSLSFGAIIALSIAVLQIIGKMPKNIHMLIRLGVITLILWLLRPILDELCILLTCAFCGEFLSWALFTKPIKTIKKRKNISEIAKIKNEIELQDDITGRV